MSLKTMPAESRTTEQADESPLVSPEQGVPVLYSDGPGEVEIHGQIVRITYFEFHGEGPNRVRRPVLEMIRPLATCGDGRIGAMVARKRSTSALSH